MNITQRERERVRETDRPFPRLSKEPTFLEATGEVEPGLRKSRAAVQRVDGSWVTLGHALVLEDFADADVLVNVTLATIAVIVETVLNRKNQEKTQQHLRTSKTDHDADNQKSFNLNPQALNPKT